MQIFNKEVPAKWLEVLSVVQSVFPQAVLAGGCLRDLALGGEVKDLDVFVPYDPTVYTFPDEDPVVTWGSPDKMDDLAHQSGWRSLPPNDEMADHDYGNFAAVVADLKDYLVPGLAQPVQVIHLDLPEWSPMAVLERMDFGACQLGIDRTGFHATMVAQVDIATHRITLLHDDPNRVAWSIKRGVRFRRKYQGTHVHVDLRKAAVYFADINEVEAQ
jgi:hypothetical protein